MIQYDATEENFCVNWYKVDGFKNHVIHLWVKKFSLVLPQILIK